jgi:hypothetical protein
MTNATETPVAAPAPRVYTREEMAAFSAEQNARYAIQYKRMRESLTHLYEWMGECLTSRQAYAIERVVMKTLTSADYFAKKNVTVEVETPKVIIHGRKHSPNKVVSGEVKVKVDGKELTGAQAWYHIGKRGKLTGSILEFGLGGRSIDLEKGY